MTVLRYLVTLSYSRHKGQTEGRLKDICLGKSAEDGPENMRTVIEIGTVDMLSE